jgi:predicted DNA-binding transcriptional regulator AlpA
MSNQPRVFIRLQAVLARTAFSHSGLYSAMATQDFPRPFKLSEHGRAVAWAENEVSDWAASRVRAQPRAAPPNEKAAPRKRAAFEDAIKQNKYTRLARTLQVSPAPVAVCGAKS